MPTTPKTRLKELPPNVARQIAKLPSHRLVSYRDEHGKRLSLEAVKAEIGRRVREQVTPGHPKEHPLVRKAREWQASRVLGAPVKAGRGK